MCESADELYGEGKGNVDEHFLAVYQELRRLASAVSRGGAKQTLSPTALVNEAYLKLASSKELADTSPLHFKRIAAHAMRQVLCDAARRRGAIKRGGEAAIRVPLDDQFEKKAMSLEQLFGIWELIEHLRELSPRQAAVVEYRFYGGLSDEDIAGELAISRPTVERDWRAARAWLASHLTGRGQSA